MLKKITLTLSLILLTSSCLHSPYQDVQRFFEKIKNTILQKKSHQLYQLLSQRFKKHIQTQLHNIQKALQSQNSTNFLQKYNLTKTQILHWTPQHYLQFALNLTHTNSFQNAKLLTANLDRSFQKGKITYQLHSKTYTLLIVHEGDQWKIDKFPQKQLPQPPLSAKPKN